MDHSDPDPPDLADLVTEQRRADLADLDRRGTADLVALMAEDQADGIAEIVAAREDASPRRSMPSSSGCAGAGG